MLAFGVGTTTAMFSLVNSILLEPLPYPESDRLVRLTHTISNAGRATVDLSDAIVMLYQSEAQAFDGVAAWRFDDGDLGASEAGQTAIRVRGARVTASFFDVLGARSRSAGLSPRARTGPARVGSSYFRTASGRNAFTATPAPSADRSS